MNVLRLFFILVLCSCVPAPAAALGAPTCTDHKTFVDQLARDYGEVRQSGGLAGNEQVVEIFASLQTGSWTIIMTDQNGRSCMIAAGMMFTMALPGAPA